MASGSSTIGLDLEMEWKGLQGLIVPGIYTLCQKQRIGVCMENGKAKRSLTRRRSYGMVRLTGQSWGQVLRFLVAWLI